MVGAAHGEKDAGGGRIGAADLVGFLVERYGQMFGGLGVP